MFVHVFFTFFTFFNRFGTCTHNMNFRMDVREALLYDVTHSDHVSKFLDSRKQLYEKKSCLFKLTFNKAKGHQTPFYVVFPEFDPNFRAAYPEMGHNKVGSMYYVPSQATEKQFQIPAPTRLHWESFITSPQFLLLEQVCSEIPDYVYWRSDAFEARKPFQFVCSDATNDCGKYFISKYQLLYYLE